MNNKKLIYTICVNICLSFKQNSSLTWHSGNFVCLVRAQIVGRGGNTQTHRYCIYTSFTDLFSHSCLHPFSLTGTSIPVAPALPQDSSPHPRALHSSATITPASRTSVQPLAHNSSCCPLCMSSHTRTSSTH